MIPPKVCWILVAAQLEYPNRRGKIPQKRFICAKQQIFLREASLIVATSPPVILYDYFALSSGASGIFFPTTYPYPAR